MSNYQAGACNIGPSEIKRRRQGALVGAVLFAITTILFVVTDASTSTRLVTFIPALLFAVGMIQSKRRFCVAYGFMGVFSFEKLGDTKKVTVNQDLKADKKYAVKLLLQSVAIAIVLTALVILL
ncbi:MAG: hypothetical protein KGM39_05240 [Actinomycetales bacterium]|nr:hypothetical protein [Actinomycetales bacterium]